MSEHMCAKEDSDIPSIALELGDLCGPEAAITFLRACGLDLTAERRKIAEVRRRRALMISGEQEPCLMISQDQRTGGEP